MSKLEARIRMVNRANAYANKLQPLLRAALGGLLMTKILKADGEFLKSVEAILPKEATLDETGIRVYRRWRLSSDLVWDIVTNETVGGVTQYHTTSIYLASTDGPILRSFYDWPTLRDDFNAAEILALRAEYHTAEEAASEAKRKLVPFGAIVDI